MSAFERTFKVASRIVSYDDDKNVAIAPWLCGTPACVVPLSRAPFCSDRRCRRLCRVAVVLRATTGCLAVRRPGVSPPARCRRSRRPSPSPARGTRTSSGSSCTTGSTRCASGNRTNNSPAREHDNQPINRPTNQSSYSPTFKAQQYKQRTHTYTRLTALCPGLDYPGER